jgi:single-stranded DNA-binding protein
MFRVTVSGPREQEASFFAVVLWRDQAEHVAESLSKGSRIVVVGRLQQRAWTAEDDSGRSAVEVVGRGAGVEAALGDGDHDQGDAQPEPVVSSNTMTGRGVRRSMLAFRSVMSTLLSFVVKSFSTNSRPALRAAACGGRPRPATPRSSVIVASANLS